MATKQLNSKFFFLLILVFTGLLLPSCKKKKYPDGGSYSLLSKKARVDNSWIFGVVMGGENMETDMTSDFLGTYTRYNIVLTKDGNFGVYYKINNTEFIEAGKWQLMADETILHMTSNSGGSYEWKILKLKNKELWITDTHFKGAPVEIHFVPKNK